MIPAGILQQQALILPVTSLKQKTKTLKTIISCPMAPNPTSNITNPTSNILVTCTLNKQTGNYPVLFQAS